MVSVEHGHVVKYKIAITVEGTQGWAKYDGLSRLETGGTARSICGRIGERKIAKEHSIFVRIENDDIPI